MKRTGEVLAALVVVDVSTAIVAVHAQAGAFPAGQTPGRVGFGAEAEGEGTDVAADAAAAAERVHAHFEVDGLGDARVAGRIMPGRVER